MVCVFTIIDIILQEGKMRAKSGIANWVEMGLESRASGQTRLARPLEGPLAPDPSPTPASHDIAIGQKSKSPRGLMKTVHWGLLPELSVQEVQVEACKFAFSNKFPGDVDTAVWRPHFVHHQ